MKVLISDIAIGLALVLAAVFLLLSQNMPVQDVVLSGAAVIILTMVRLFFSLNRNSKTKLFIRITVPFIFAYFLYKNTSYIYFLPALAYSTDNEKEYWIPVLTAFSVENSPLATFPAFCASPIILRIFCLFSNIIQLLC